MNPKYLIVATAGLYGIVGLGLLFFSQELLAASGRELDFILPVQLIAPGFAAIAILNWAGRNAIYGGIYGRPIVLANMMFSVLSATTLASGITDYGLSGAWWILVAALALVAVSFGILMRSAPWSPKASRERAD